MYSKPMLGGLGSAKSTLALLHRGREEWSLSLVDPCFHPLPVQSLLTHVGVLCMATKNSCVQAFVGTYLPTYIPLKP